MQIDLQSESRGGHLLLEPAPPPRATYSRWWWLLGVCLTTILSVSSADATDFVYVGDAGNSADTSGYGNVGYAYEIGKYEFTNSQYVQYLNAVDPQGLNPNGIWNTSMQTGVASGIGFTSGNAAGSKYATLSNMADKPVNYVSWFDAARVANWLQSGAQTYATTISGSTAINTGVYTLNGVTSGTAPAPTSAPTFWIPTENEWYKAAYYKGGGTNAGFWAYATQSNSSPTAVGATIVGSGTTGGVSPVVSGNSANWNAAANWNGSAAGNVTSVGSNGGPSAYGTYDMTGNQWEWNDLTAVSGTTRELRGGSWGNQLVADMTSSARYPNFDPSFEGPNVGFRLASTVPTALTWNTTSGTWGGGTLNWTNGAGSTYSLPAGSSAAFTGTSGGTITLSGSMQPTAVSVSAASGTYTFVTAAGSVISGTGALTKTGAGVLVLSGSNAYSGGTNLSAGTLRVGHDGALGTGTLTLAGGTLASADGSTRSFANAVSITADTTFGDATGTGAMVLSGSVGLGGGTRILNTASNLTISGAVTNGSLTKSGAGTLTLSGSNSYSGGTNINAGTLALNNANALGTSGTIAFGGGTLQFTANNSTDYSSRFSSAASQAYKLDTNGQNVTLLSALTSSGGSLTKSGAGTLTLSGSNTYSGGTTVSAGTLVGNTASLQGSITNSAAVTFDQSTSGTYSSTISGNGSVTKTGSGKLTLSGTQTYTGATTVQAGTLALSGTLSSSPLTVQAGATLAGTGFLGSSLSVSGTLAPGNSPGMITAATLTLASSATTVMEIAGSATAGTDYDTIVVSNAGGLTYGGALDVVFSNANVYADGTTFRLFQFTGSPSGTFSSIVTTGSGAFAGLTFAPNPDGTWYTADTVGHQFLRFAPLSGSITVVPEPSTWAMAFTGLAVAAGLAYRRRKR